MAWRVCMPVTTGCSSASCPAAVRASTRVARDSRHRCLRIRKRELRALADDAAPFQVLPGEVTRRVDQGDDGQSERVTEADETRALLRRWNVERSCQGLRLIGDDADGTPGHRC